MAVKGGSRANMKPYIKRFIDAEALKKPRIPALALAVRLQQEIDKIGEPVPKEETLIKRISAVRNQDNPEDKPWHLGTLEDYPIPPDALRAVLGVWQITHTGDPDYGGDVERDPLTVREAKWIARIHPLFDVQRNLHDLDQAALYLAEEEMVTEVSNVRLPEKDYEMVQELCGWARLPEVVHNIDRWMWKDEAEKEVEAAFARLENEKKTKREGK